MHAITQALRTRIDPGTAKSLVTPLFQCSAFKGDSPYFYARKSHPNVAELEDSVRLLEGAPHAVGVSTGMAAIQISFDLLAPGDLLVLNRDTYGCTCRLADRLTTRRGLRVVTLDLSTAAGIAGIPHDVRMVFFETPTNPFLKTISIRKVASRVKSLNPSALVVVDNTWATPFFQRPLEHGAHVSLHSATKFLSGHSDVMGGILLATDAKLAQEFRDARFYGGAVLDPHSSWLLRRSLQTLPIRMEAHARTTRSMATFLRSRKEIARVYFPRIDRQQLKGYGGILFFAFRPGLSERYTDFAAKLSLFDTGTGMAAVTSTVAQPYSGSHASLTSEEKRAMGLDPGLVRLCFGLEDSDDLKADLTRAFDALRTA